MWGLTLMLGGSVVHSLLAGSAVLQPRGSHPLRQLAPRFPQKLSPRFRAKREKCIRLEGSSPETLILLRGCRCRARREHLNGDVQRFRGGLAFKAHSLRQSPNSRLESNKEEREEEQLNRV